MTKEIDSLITQAYSYLQILKHLGQHRPSLIHIKEARQNLIDELKKILQLDEAYQALIMLRPQKDQKLTLQFQNEQSLPALEELLSSDKMKETLCSLVQNSDFTDLTDHLQLEDYSCHASMLGKNIYACFILQKTEQQWLEHRQFIKLVLEAIPWLYPGYSTTEFSVEQAINSLAPRLYETLEQVMTGKAIAELAKDMGLSQQTLHKYSQQIHQHFRVNSRPELMALINPQ